VTGPHLAGWILFVCPDVTFSIEIQFSLQWNMTTRTIICPGENHEEDLRKTDASEARKAVERDCGYQSVRTGILGLPASATLTRA
jgi:hypothetical protein